MSTIIIAHFGQKGDLFSLGWRLGDWAMELETARLRVRGFAPADGEALFAALSDPEVMEYLEAPFSLKDTQEFIKTRGLRDPPLVYALVEKSTQGVIGHLIFHPYGQGSYELGWVIRRDRWGLGYAQEVTEAVMEFARKEGVGELVIECSSKQRASRRLAEKNGFHLTEETDKLLVFRWKLDG